MKVGDKRGSLEKMFFVFMIALLMITGFAIAKDFRVENSSNANQNYFSVNGTSGFVGVGTTNPTQAFHVDGNVNITGNLTLSGEVTNQNTSRFRAYRTSAQSIASGVDTIVEYNVTDFDTLGEYNGSYKFVAQEAGYYQVNAGTLSGNVAWVAGNLWMISIFKNGVQHSRGIRNQADAAVTNNRFSTVSDVVYLAANDYIDIRVYHSQGGNVDVVATANVYNYFSVTRINSPITIGSSGAAGIWTNNSGTATYDGNANVTGNLTLGDKITFVLGEIIDNIKDGWVRVTGGLEVVGSINMSGTGAALFFPDGTNMTTASSGTGIWTNNSGTATYDGNVNITGNLTLGGEVTNQNTTRFRATRSAAQSIPNSVATIVEYNETDFDTLGEYNSSYQFVATEAGYYAVSARLMSTSVVWDAGEVWFISLNKNGVLYSRGQRNVADATINTYRSSMLSDTIYLNVGDYIDIRIWHNQGAAVDIQADLVYNFFSVMRINSPITIGSSGVAGIWTNNSGNATFTSGRVGIGTSSPDSRLTVVNGNVTFYSDSMTSDERILFIPEMNVTDLNPGVTPSGAVIEGPWARHLIFDQTANDAEDSIAFRTDSNIDGTVDTIAMVIKPSGYIGIGTVSPQEKLEVNGTLQLGEGKIRFNDTSANYEFYNGSVWAEIGTGSSYIPAGAIVSFNLVSCPTGWTDIGTQNGTGIIASGNDSNGSYIKYSDGTMMVWGKASADVAINILSNGIYRSTGGAFAFEYSSGFSETPELIVTGHETSVQGASVQGSTNLTHGSVLLWSGTSVTAAVRTIHYVAMGRWTNVAQDSYKFCQKTADDSENTTSSIGTFGDATFVQNTSHNFGIGTTSPNAKLHLAVNSGVVSQQITTGDATGTPSLWFATNTSGTANWGGIGLDFPDSRLKFSTTGSFSTYTVAINSSDVEIRNGNSLTLGGVTRTTWPTGSGTGAFTDTGSLAYYNGGNVGIGTSSPASTLEVAGNEIYLNGTTFARFTLDATNGYDNLIRFFEGSTGKWLMGTDASSDNDFVISNGSSLSGNQRFVIDRGTGNVGIGTSSPTEKLHVDNGSVKIESGATGGNNLLTLNAEGTSTENSINFEEDGVIKWLVGTLDSTQEFRIRDVLNGYAPFRIAQGAIDNALYISISGFVGMGTATPNSTLEVNGSFATAIKTITTNFTIDETDSVVIVNTTISELTVTLPTAVGIKGRHYTIKKIDSTTNKVIIEGLASETIDLALNLNISLQFKSYNLVSDGNNWWVI